MENDTESAMANITKRLGTTVLVLLNLIGMELLAQDPPKSRTPYFGLRQYYEDANPSADSLNANMDAIDAAIYSGVFGSKRYLDSTTATVRIFDFLVRNDSVLAWLNRTVAGDAFATTLQARSLGRSDSSILVGLEIKSKRDDTTLVYGRAQADATFRIGGVRPTGAESRDYVIFRYDSTRFRNRVRFDSLVIFKRNVVFGSNSTFPTVLQVELNADSAWRDMLAFTGNLKGQGGVGPRVVSFNSALNLIASQANQNLVALFNNITYKNNGGYSGVNYYFLYSANTAAMSYSGGKWGVGGSAVAVPTAKMHIAASDGSANSGPLKLIPGTLVASPEVGLIETSTLDDSLRYTGPSGTRRTLALSGSGGGSGGVAGGWVRTTIIRTDTAGVKVYVPSALSDTATYTSLFNVGGTSSFGNDVVLYTNLYYKSTKIFNGADTSIVNTWWKGNVIGSGYIAETLTDKTIDGSSTFTGSGGVNTAGNLKSTGVLPATSDGAALGSSSLQWSDLFLSSGAVINFSNGDYTLTHSTGTLTASGTFKVPTLGADANLTASPTGDWIFNAGGKDIYPSTNYDQNLGLLSKKFLALHAGELLVETLVAQNTIATIGGRVIIAPTTPLVADLSTDSSYIQTKYNNIANGDRIYLEADGKVEFMTVISSAVPNGSYYRYAVTRNIDGSDANIWYAGDAVLNTGTTGNGFIDLYSVRGIKAATEYGPTIVGNVRNSATWNDWSPRWAIGNLNGLYGYSTNTYGAAFGVPTGAWIKIDPTEGLRIGHNATNFIQIAADATATMAGLTISTDALTYVGSGNTVKMSVGTTAFMAGPTGAPTFSVTQSGALTSTSGTIGGWTIGGTSLSSVSGGYTTTISSGTTSFAAGPTGAPTFTVTRAGALTATSATISGSVSANTLTMTGGSGIGSLTSDSGLEFNDTDAPATITKIYSGGLIGTYAGAEAWRITTATGEATFPTLLLSTGTPASAGAVGTTGTIKWDANYIYICTATNTWKRAAISTW